MHKDQEGRSEDEIIEMILSENRNSLSVIDEQSWRASNKITDWNIRGTSKHISTKSSQL